MLQEEEEEDGDDDDDDGKSCEDRTSGLSGNESDDMEAAANLGSNDTPLLPTEGMATPPLSTEAPPLSAEGVATASCNGVVSTEEDEEGVGLEEDSAPLGCDDLDAKLKIRDSASPEISDEEDLLMLQNP